MTKTRESPPPGTSRADNGDLSGAVGFGVVSADSHVGAGGSDNNCLISQANSFPAKVHRMLTDIDQADNGGFEKIVSWAPHGRAFVIRNKQAFISEVMPKYFCRLKFVSFTRQLNLYGFKKIHAQGRDKGGFYHPLFLRGTPELAFKIERVKGGSKKSNDKKSNKTQEQEPCFYAMRPLNPRDLDEAKPKSGDSDNLVKDRNPNSRKTAYSACYLDNECDPSVEHLEASSMQQEPQTTTTKWFSDTPSHIKSEVNLSHMEDLKDLLAPIINDGDSTPTEELPRLQSEQSQLQVQQQKHHHQPHHDYQQQLTDLFHNHVTRRRDSLELAMSELRRLQEDVLARQEQRTLTLGNHSQGAMSFPDGPLFAHGHHAADTELSFALEPTPLKHEVVPSNKAMSAFMGQKYFHEHALHALQSQQQFLDYRISSFFQQQQLQPQPSEANDTPYVRTQWLTNDSGSCL